MAAIEGQKKQKKAPYRKQRGGRDCPGRMVLEIEASDFVTGEDVQVDLGVIVLPYHRYFGLDDRFVGVLDPAKGDEPGREGESELARRREKFCVVVEDISNLHPEDYPGGRLTSPKAIRAFADDPTNANVVYLGMQVYDRRVRNPYPKSGDDAAGESGGDGGSGGDGADEASAGPHVSGVSGGSAATS